MIARNGSYICCVGRSDWSRSASPHRCHHFYAGLTTSSAFELCDQFLLGGNECLALGGVYPGKQL